MSKIRARRWLLRDYPAAGRQITAVVLIAVDLEHQVHLGIRPSDLRPPLDLALHRAPLPRQELTRLSRVAGLRGRLIAPSPPASLPSAGRARAAGLCQVLATNSRTWDSSCVR